MLVMSIKCVNGCYVMDGLVYLCDGLFYYFCLVLMKWFCIFRFIKLLYLLNKYIFKILLENFFKLKKWLQFIKKKLKNVMLFNEICILFRDLCYFLESF